MSAYFEDKLPTSYINEVESISQNVTVIRSNLRNLEDCNNWVKEYGKLTNTKWNTRSSKPCAERIVCSKKYVCHHSSFMKVSPEANRSISKNSHCMATINVKVKLDTATTRRRDSFVRKGLFAVIKINDTHNHSLNTAESLKFLPNSDCREKFLEYFKCGMGIAEALKYYEETLQFEEKFTEEGMTNNPITPPYRVVQHWYNQWRHEKPGPRIGQAQNKTDTETESLNVAEPSIVIKQEPVESTDEPPSPVNDSILSVEELIPFSRSSSISSFLLPSCSSPHSISSPSPFPESVLPGPEPDSTNVEETPVLNEPERKRKMSNSNPDVDDSTSSATQDQLGDLAQQPLLSKRRRKPRSPYGAKKFVGSSFQPTEDTQNATRELFQSLLNGSESNPSSGSRTEEIPGDLFDVFGNYISQKLRQMNWDHCALALRAILDIVSQPDQVQQISGDEDSDISDLASSLSSSCDQE